MARRYRVNVDNDTTLGVDVDLSVDMTDFASREALEGALAEATRRILCAAFSETPIDACLPETPEPRPERLPPGRLVHGGSSQPVEATRRSTNG